MERILMRPQEAAEALGVSRSFVYELIRSGELPSVRLGRAIRLPTDALRRWAEARTEAANNREETARSDPKRKTAPKERRANRILRQAPRGSKR